MEKHELYFYPKQSITLNDFDANGLILDIAGGGEGVIAQLKEDQVIAIDKNVRELKEAPSGGLKLEMDASDLKFLNQSFNTVTIFFGLMYMPTSLHRKVLEEVLRVLKPGGLLHVWDFELKQPFVPDKKGFAFYLDVKLPDRLVQTGYGSPYPQDTHDLVYYQGLLEEVGFEIEEKSQAGMTFYLRAKRPTAA